MATAHPVQVNKAELTCSICLDLFRDPVTTECGHSFCRDCITQLCEEGKITVVCPHCRSMFHRKNLKPNRELKNIVDSVRQLSALQEEEESGRVTSCEKHNEPLKLYCKNDQRPICVICRESVSHRAHAVVPIEEAVQEYRDKIRENLEAAESTYEKLFQLVEEDGKHLPQSAREEEHERLRRLTDKVKTGLKVNPERTRPRFKSRTLLPLPPKPELKSCSPGTCIAMGPETQEHKESEKSGESVAAKEEEGSHVVQIWAEAPDPKYGLAQASLDPTVHYIPNTTEDAEDKVDVRSLTSRFESLSSPTRSVGCTRRSPTVAERRMQSELSHRLKQRGDVQSLRKKKELQAEPPGKPTRPSFQRSNSASLVDM
ncbi:uncharacterized protein LOC142024615 [Carettochelys insculpta]|uniref:uncharacterized protein LOC142024615 n=1 Tax=Carettochelys insculpta TaxID=44489 RepID=UPI003EBC8B85